MKQIFALIASGFILGAVNWVNAQQPPRQVPRIGFVSPATRSPLFDSLQQGLRDLGYVDGKNILIEWQSAEGRLDRMRGLVSELVQKKVDVIVVVNNVAIRAAKETTKTIPIVMVTSVDPVDAGYVKSFAHPGGNITGLANLGRDLSAKRVELLRALLPKMSRVGILWDADGPGPAIAFKEYEAAAEAFKLGFDSLEVRGPIPDFARSFQSGRTARADALIVVGNPLVFQHSKELFDLATKNRLATMTEEGRYVKAGGLISYGANLVDLYRRAAEYVVEILKGAKPADMPVKLPDKFEIFINLKTAQQLGVTIPQHVMLQADKVIK